jgi:hypothetical protein
VARVRRPYRGAGVDSSHPRGRMLRDPEPQATTAARVGAQAGSGQGASREPSPQPLASPTGDPPKASPSGPVIKPLDIGATRDPALAPAPAPAPTPVAQGDPPSVAGAEGTGAPTRRASGGASPASATAPAPAPAPAVAVAVGGPGGEGARGRSGSIERKSPRLQLALPTATDAAPATPSTAAPTTAIPTATAPQPQPQPAGGDPTPAKCGSVGGGGASSPAPQAPQPTPTTELAQTVLLKVKSDAAAASDTPAPGDALSARRALEAVKKNVQADLQGVTVTAPSAPAPDSGRRGSARRPSLKLDLGASAATREPLGAGAPPPATTISGPLMSPTPVVDPEAHRSGALQLPLQLPAQVQLAATAASISEHDSVLMGATATTSSDLEPLGASRSQPLDLTATGEAQAPTVMETTAPQPELTLMDVAAMEGVLGEDDEEDDLAAFGLVGFPKGAGGARAEELSEGGSLDLASLGGLERWEGTRVALTDGR